MNKIMSEYIKSRSLRLGRNRVAQRGIALIMTLLILSMVIMLSLGMVIALSSQTFIGGYYRNFRGSFYAADSGLNVARQALANQLTASVPGTFATPPIANPTAVASTVLSTMLGNYGSSSTIKRWHRGQFVVGELQDHQRQLFPGHRAQRLPPPIAMQRIARRSRPPAQQPIATPMPTP